VLPCVERNGQPAAWAEALSRLMNSSNSSWSAFGSAIALDPATTTAFVFFLLRFFAAIVDFLFYAVRGFKTYRYTVAATRADHHVYDQITRRFTARGFKVFESSVAFVAQKHHPELGEFHFFFAVA
jgi:hypothetical protein